MTKEELKERFNRLYRVMATSNNPKYMGEFGSVMKEMMAWMVENKPELAEEYIDKLGSIEWRQYLTRSEATEVVRDMIPAAPWDYSTWERAMQGMSLESERAGVYNRYALWAVMNQVYTDFGESIARMMGEPLEKIPADTLVPFIHDMALDLLTDKDGRYCVREYLLGR